MDKKVLVPIAQGTEETEAVTIIDLLRRAGLKVIVVADNDIITCSRGIKIIPDKLFRDLDDNLDFDAVIIPGGTEGTGNLMNNDILEKILKKHNNNYGLTGAICAAPTILARHKILPPGDKITFHPSVINELKEYHYLEENVVESANILTSRGVGTAIEFSLAIIRRLCGVEKSEEIAKSILYK